MNRLVVARACFAALLLILTRSTALAGGINLSWDDCGVSGQLQRNFACNSNSGNHVLVGSAVAPVPLEFYESNFGSLNLQTNQPALSPWWSIGSSPNCRATNSMVLNLDFTGMTNCVDPILGENIGQISYTPLFGGANRARIRTISAWPHPPISIDNTTEFYIFKIVISNARTTGSGSCAGCTDGACIVFNSLELMQEAPWDDYLLTNPLSSQHVLWQSGAGSCPAATPARAQTWGSIKSLYR